MQQSHAQMLGALRAAVGGALVVAPAFAGKVWIGSHAQGPGTRVFARALGARDLALGLRIVQVARSGRLPRELLTFGALADAMDVAATIIAGKHLTPARRMAMPLIAGAVGALGAMVVRDVQPRPALTAVA